MNARHILSLLALSLAAAQPAAAQYYIKKDDHADPKTLVPKTWEPCCKVPKPITEPPASQRKVAVRPVARPPEPAPAIPLSACRDQDRALQASIQEMSKNLKTEGERNPQNAMKWIDRFKDPSFMQAMMTANMNCPSSAGVPSK